MPKLSAGLAACFCLALWSGASPIAAQPPGATGVTAIRAGRLLDPEAGRILTNQIIVVEGNRIREVGPNVAIPAGAQVIDLSGMTVMPGLVDAHDHLALTYKPEPENNIYYYVIGKTRGEVCLEFPKTWTDAGIPNADILRAMTINGYKVSQTETTRGPIKAGYIADLIALPGNPLDDVSTLKRVQFVMKDGLVFKRDGVMTPAAFFHGGPVNGWRIR